MNLCKFKVSLINIVNFQTGQGSKTLSNVRQGEGNKIMNYKYRLVVESLLRMCKARS